MSFTLKMADSEDLLTDIDLSQVDTDHLTRQALQLFRKRYGKYYDNYCEILDKDKRGYVTREDFTDAYTFLSQSMPLDEVNETTDVIWIFTCGGQKDVSQLSREKLVDLWIKGYHSKDREHVKSLTDATIKLCNFHFDLADTNHDGIISEEEFIAVKRARVQMEDWKEEFEALDLNGNGQIEREEYLQCCLGYFFHIDEERYNHFFGMVNN